MIKDIVELIYEISREHKLIRSFRYDSISKGLGIGDEKMCHCLLEDPIYINEVGIEEGIVFANINFNIMSTIHLFDNVEGIRQDVEGVQSICYDIALNYIARMREMYENDETQIKVHRYSIITLHHYGDNDCDGVRVSMRISFPNPIEFCDLDNHFDIDGEFEVSNLLPKVKTDSFEGCNASFQYKLPKITL